MFNYAFETTKSLNDLRCLLAELEKEIYAFRLICPDKEIIQRIQTRSSDPERVRWELQRIRELAAIQEANARWGNLGKVIDSTHLSARETARAIWERIHTLP